MKERKVCNEVLEDFDDEDISDIILILEKSFAIKFEKDAFRNVELLGDLIDIVQESLLIEHVSSCTSQQAYYKIREAITNMALATKESVMLETKLAQLFPFKNRLKLVKDFKRQLGIEIKLLYWPKRVTQGLTIAMIISFIAIFFYWKIGLACMLVFGLALKAGDWLGKSFQFNTVESLTRYLFRERYAESRRNPGTINKNEIEPVIIKLFSDRLQIDEKHLTRDAKFSWTKTKAS